MCGIYAEIRRPGDTWMATEAHKAVSTLYHRGPDNAGVNPIPIDWAQAVLAMDRLAIVGGNHVSVPYFFPELRVMLAYNGEVYNWRELRAELGGRWSTECDAEVIAVAWREWGPDMLKKLNGMWAMVLVDTRRQVIFVSRDRAGEKPLYWSEYEGRLCFTSEIKAFPFQFEPIRCQDAEVLEFDCGRRTPISGVYAVSPGSYAELSSPEHVRSYPDQERRWWSLPQETDDSLSLAEATEETHRLLRSAVKLRSASEVPVALLLSGGLDSAIIRVLAGDDPKDLLCVDFPDDGIDNLTVAQLAAQGREVTPVTFAQDDMWSVLEKVAYHLDTPATWTAVCQWFLFQQAAALGNKVALSGEGADELFGGYSRYRVLYWLDEMAGDERLLSYRGVVKKTIGFDVLDEMDRTTLMGQMLNRGGDETEEAARKIVQDYYPAKGMADSMARVEFHTTMQVLLRMADRMSSAWSLESRSPFLDHRVMEFAARIPGRLKVTENGSKIVLREVARLLGVPSPIVEEKTKKGLFIPPSWGPARPNKWDRSWFRDAMAKAWKSAFFGAR